MSKPRRTDPDFEESQDHERSWHFYEMMFPTPRDKALHSLKCAAYMRAMQAPRSCIHRYPRYPLTGAFNEAHRRFVENNQIYASMKFGLGEMKKRAYQASVELWIEEREANKETKRLADTIEWIREMQT